MKIFTDRGLREEISRRELAKEEEEYRNREWHELRGDVMELHDMARQMLMMIETMMEGKKDKYE